MGAWQAAYCGVVPSDYLDDLSVEKREASWRAAIAGNDLHMLVAKLNDHIVGWVAFEACSDAGATAAEGEICINPSARFTTSAKPGLLRR